MLPRKHLLEDGSCLLESHRYCLLDLDLFITGLSSQNTGRFRTDMFVLQYREKSVMYLGRVNTWVLLHHITRNQFAAIRGVPTLRVPNGATNNTTEYGQRYGQEDSATDIVSHNERDVILSLPYRDAQ